MRVVMRGDNRWKREINRREKTDKHSDEREWEFMRERMQMTERIREQL